MGISSTKLLVMGMVMVLVMVLVMVAIGGIVMVMVMGHTVTIAHEQVVVEITALMMIHDRHQE